MRSPDDWFTASSAPPTVSRKDALWRLIDDAHARVWELRATVPGWIAPSLRSATSGTPRARGWALLASTAAGYRALWPGRHVVHAPR